MNPLRDRLVSLLRWSERYTRTDMVYLTAGGIWLGIGQVAATLAGFALTITLANLLSPEVLGEYRYLMSGLLILTIFALPGMRSALVESTPKGFLGNLRTAFKAMFRWGMLGSGAAFAVAIYYLSSGNISLAIGFCIIGAALPVLDASAAHIEYLKALRKFKRVAVYTLIVRAIGVALVLGTALLYPAAGWLILAAFVLGSILPNLYFHLKTLRDSAKAHEPADPGLIPYAKHLSVMAALSLLSMQLDKVLIWYFLGAEELALFFIAYAIPQEAVRFLAIVPTLAFPKFSTAARDAVHQTLLRKLFIYACIVSLLVAAYFLMAPLLFSALFPQYLAAVPYSQALMLAAIASAFLPISTYFTAHRRTRILYQLASIIPAARIVATVSLIALYGLWGAVYAILLEAVVTIACYLYFFIRDRAQQ